MRKSGTVVFYKVGDSKVNPSEQMTELNPGKFWDNSKAVPFRSTRLLLGIIGAVPITWKKPHDPSLHPTKSTFPLALTLVFLATLSAYSIFTTSVAEVMNDKVHVQGKILNIEVLVLCGFYFLVPTAWTDVSKAKRGTYSWRRLMKLYEELTGDQLQLGYRHSEKIVNGLVLVMPSIAFVLGKESNPDMKVEYTYAPSFIYFMTIVLLLCVLWTGYFLLLKKLARKVNVYLTEELRRGLLAPERLTYYRKIWLEMRSLSDSMNSMNAPVLVWFLIIILLVFTSYEVIVMIGAKNYISAMAHLIVCSSYMALLAAMARASHVAVQEIKGLYAIILAKEPLSPLQQNTQRDIISMYLTENMRTTSVSFGGFAVVNKGFLISVISTIATHLVVVFQLTQSANC